MSGTANGGEQAIVDAFTAPFRQHPALTAAVMVSSVDGRVTVNGRVGGLTAKPDQRILLAMRELAAVVVAGGATVRAEGYAGLLGEEAQARRRASGLPSEPELAVLTRRAGAGLPAGARALTPRSLADGRPDLAAAWQELRARHGDGLIVCEGGPTLLGQLVLQRVLDQLLVGISPQLTGERDALRLIERSDALADAPVQLRLLDIARIGDFVFLRYGTIG